MPSKIQLDENLWFLFICLQKSDFKMIDFNAVGQATNLKAPAARMRYTRLRRQIEGGILARAHGVPFSAASGGIVQATQHRKKSSPRNLSIKDQQTYYQQIATDAVHINLENKESSDESKVDEAESSDVGVMALAKCNVEE